MNNLVARERVPTPHSQAFLPSSFDCLKYAKMEGGRLSPFYHVNIISVPLDRQREGGVLNQNNTFRARILRFKPGVVHFSLSERSKLQCWG